MTDKGTTDDIAQRYIAVVDERDDLRSEVITLEWQLSEATNEVERLKALETWYTEAIDALHVDIEHLKAELGEVTDLYTTYRGLVHDGVQVADVIKSVRGQLAALRISERAWTDQNERLRALLIALLAQMDRDVGRLREGKLSDLRIEAAALVGYEGLGERN